MTMMARDRPKAGAAGVCRWRVARQHQRGDDDETRAHCPFYRPCRIRQIDGGGGVVHLARNTDGVLRSRPSALPGASWLYLAHRRARRPIASRAGRSPVAACCGGLRVDGRDLHRMGFDFAVSAFRPPGSWQGCWEQLDTMNPLIVVLLPALEVLLARDAERSGRSHCWRGRRSAGPELCLGSIWRADPRALMIDNSDLSVEQVAALVETELMRRSAHAEPSFHDAHPIGIIC